MLTYLLGMAGAAAPEVLRFYRARLVPISSLPRHYWVISALYLGLGGLVATLLAAPGNPWSAFYVGLALPIVISTAQRTVPGSAAEVHSIEEYDARDTITFREKFGNYARLI